MTEGHDASGTKNERSAWRTEGVRRPVEAWARGPSELSATRPQRIPFPVNGTCDRAEAASRRKRCL